MYSLPCLTCYIILLVRLSRNVRIFSDFHCSGYPKFVLEIQFSKDYASLFRVVFVITYFTIYIRANVQWKKFIGLLMGHREISFFGIKTVKFATTLGTKMK